MPPPTPAWRARREGFFSALPSANGDRSPGSRRGSAREALGPRSRLRCDRDRRDRSRRRRGAAPRVARTRLARRDGLYGAPWSAPRAACGAHSRNCVRDHGATELHARYGARFLGNDRGSRKRLRLALRAGTRLPQGAARQAAGARRSHDAGARALPLSCLHRQRAGDGSLARGGERPGLARQAHTAALARCRFSVLPGRALCEPRPGEGRECHRALRNLRALHRHLPDAGDRRPLPARCTALHLVSHHRAPRHDSRGTASAHGQPDLRLRRLPARVSLEQVRERQRGSGFRRAQRPRFGGASRSLRVERGRIQSALRRLRDPAHRARTVAAQHRCRAWECAHFGPRRRGPRGATRSSVGARARARSMVARAPPCHRIEISMTPRSLLVAVACVYALLSSSSALAVYVSDSGSGEALIYPYYTVRDTEGDAFNNYASIANADTAAKAFRVRFREGRNGREVASFNLFPPPPPLWPPPILPS